MRVEGVREGLASRGVMRAIVSLMASTGRSRGEMLFFWRGPDAEQIILLQMRLGMPDMLCTALAFLFAGSLSTSYALLTCRYVSAHEP